ncbi:ribosomal protein L25 (general stress protein Ctc) [Skermanella aerolata]
MGNWGSRGLGRASRRGPGQGTSRQKLRAANQKPAAIYGFG